MDTLQGDRRRAGQAQGWRPEHGRQQHIPGTPTPLHQKTCQLGGGVAGEQAMVVAGGGGDP
jgi:hypothetical protein